MCAVQVVAAVLADTMQQLKSTCRLLERLCLVVEGEGHDKGA